MKLLLTAFEPFGGEATNAALEAVTRVAAPNGVTLVKRTVPTVFGACIDAVTRAIEAERPDAIVMVGQASGRKAITPERVAINVRDARIPDNAGSQPVDEPIAPTGPAAYFSTLPLRRMIDAAQAVGVPAALSNTAGTFVCNDLFYGVLDFLAAQNGGSPAVPAGFVHVPCTPEQAAAFDPSLASMALADIVKGLEAMIGALV